MKNCFLLPYYILSETEKQNFPLQICLSTHSRSIPPISDNSPGMCGHSRMILLHNRCMAENDKERADCSLSIPAPDPDASTPPPRRKGIFDGACPRGYTLRRSQ